MDEADCDRLLEGYCSDEEPRPKRAGKSIKKGKQKNNNKEPKPKGKRGSLESYCDDDEAEPKQAGKSNKKGKKKNDNKTPKPKGRGGLSASYCDDEKGGKSKKKRKKKKENKKPKPSAEEKPFRKKKRKAPTKKCDDVEFLRFIIFDLEKRVESLEHSHGPYNSEKPALLDATSHSGKYNLDATSHSTPTSHKTPLEYLFGKIQFRAPISV